ncbi:MAG: hypothetical protein WAV11_02015 [Minisyncoccia bacterium]
MKKVRGFHLKFEGKKDIRSEFLRKVKDTIMGSLDCDNANYVAMFLVEIIKNIYDHADGYGEAKLTERQDEPNIFDFVVFDEGTIRYDFEECLRKSEFAGDKLNHPENYGIGLGLIMDLSDMKGVTLAIDTTKGFRYTGTIDLNIV